jgi:hypothetical protein
VAAEGSIVPLAAKKARGSGGARRCRNCRETGHNVRSCKKAIEILSESEASTQYIFSNNLEPEDIE